MALQNLRSNTANKRPTASGMVDGQVAINTNATNPALFFKDADDGIRKVGPVFIGSSAPNSSPAAGGSTGHSIGEQWLDTSASRYVLKTWDGTAWRDDDSNYLQLTGGALSGALTIDNAANIAALDLKFDGDTDTGFYAPAANTLGFVGGGTERLRIDSSGKFGFGTSTVSTAKFTFNSGGTNEVARFESTDPGAYLSFKDSTSSSINFIEGGADQLSFGTNNAERLRIDSSGNVGIGTSSPVANTPLTLQGPSGYTDTLWLKSTGTNIDSRINFGPTGTGNAQINNATGTDIAFQVSGSEKLRIDSLGRLGIGTSSPNNELHVSGSGAFSGTASSLSNDQVQIGFVAPEGFIKAKNSSGSPAANLGLYTTNASGTTSKIVHVTYDGNVGVGNSSPSSYNAAADNLVVGATGDTGVTVASGSSSQGSLFFADGTSGSAVAEGYLIYVHSSNYMAMGTANTERLRIDSSGRVGIGTSSPASKAHIKGGSLTVEHNSPSTGTGQFNINSESNSQVSLSYDDQGHISVGTASAPAGQTGFSEKVRIDSSGNVGIGTNSPGALLHVGNTTRSNTNLTVASSTSGAGGLYFNDGANSGALIYHHTDNYLQFRANGSERMRIDSSGNVGIGTTSPSMKVNISHADQDGLRFNSVASGETFIDFADPDDNDIGRISYDHNDNHMAFRANNGERLRIDSSGRLLVGTNSGNDSGSESNLIIESNSSSDSSYGGLMLRRGSTSINSGTSLGRMYFADQNGNTGARISGLADGTWATDDYPGVITFDTTADGASSVTERMRIDSSGNVGIGHSSPASLLTVGGDAITTAKPTVAIAPDTGNGSITLRRGSPTLYFDVTAGGNGTIIYDNDSDLLFKKGTLDSSTEHMRIANNGNVGIGNSSPSSKLDVAGDIRIGTGQAILSTSSGGTVQIQGGATFPGGNILLGGGSGTDDIRFRTTGASATSTERMRIDSSGDVGIGTSQPAFTEGSGLRIERDTIATIRLQDTGHHGFEISASSDDAKFRTMNNKPFVFADGSDNELVRIDSSGNVGIGTTSPNAYSNYSTLTINGTTSGEIDIEANGTLVGQLYGASGVFSLDARGESRDLRFRTNTVERMRIDSSGYVGIGTSSPARLFEVKGSASGHFDAAKFSNGQDNGSSDSVSINFGLARTGGLTFDAAKIKAIKENAFTSTPSTVNSALTFETIKSESRTEKMRIFSTGQTHHFSEQGVLFTGTAQGAGTTYWLFRGNRNRTSNTAGGVTVFYVWSNGNVQNTNNSYTAISDVKLKENIVDATSQWDDLKAIQVRKYNFIEGETHTQLGVIAQEVETVSPGLVNDIVDRDEEGNDLGTVTKSVNYSVLYMKAVKALQEAMERIETLEAKVAALEAE